MEGMDRPPEKRRDAETAIGAEAGTYLDEVTSVTSEYERIKECDRSYCSREDDGHHWFCVGFTH